MNFSSPALITGASGFVGSHLAEELARHKVKVKLLVRKTSRLPFPQTAQMELCFGDITDFQTVRNAVRGVKVIYHSAGILRGADFSAYQRVNAEGTRNVCKAAEQEKGFKRLVYLSSLSAAGPSSFGSEIDETMPCQPVSFYGQSKLMGEQIVLSYQKKFEVTILRPGAVYGPRETDIFEYFKMVRQGLVFNAGDGTQKISFVYVDDLVNGILLAGQSPRARGQIFFISDGYSLNWNQFASYIGKILKKSYISFNVPLGIVRIVASLGDWWASLTGKSFLPPILSRDKLKEAEAPSWVCKNEKIRKRLGFKPKFDIENGLTKTVQFYLTSGRLKP